MRNTALADRHAPAGELAAAADTVPLLHDPDNLFRKRYNTESFMFPHELHGRDVFGLPGLAGLAERLPQTDEFVYWSNGPVDVTSRWEDGKSGRHSLQDTIRGIATNNSMVILKHVEQDPVAGPVLRDFLAQVVELSGSGMRDDIIVGEALILLASPNRITSYHMDAECNYLVQLAGSKTLNVFDPLDRTLVTDEELERFHDGDYNGALYKPERQADARSYALRAGHGVHIPVGAPHWVKNGNNISVALSINYELRSVHRASRIYRVNRHLRRLGMTPKTPGSSGWRDRLKLAAAFGLYGRERHRPAHGVWTP